MLNGRTPSLIVGVITLLSFAAGGARAEQPKPLPADLEQRMRECFAGIETPGAVYGVYRGAEVKPELRLTLGYNDERHTRPITFADHFRIASVTKTFVGTVVLQLIDEGKLSLDDTVAKYVDGVPGGDRITIEMLGHHTSGLANFIANPKMQAAIVADPSHNWTDAEILPYAFELPARFEPGKGWYYSNTNTVVLGKVIEKVTGQTWKQQVQTRVLDRLGLKQTGFPDEKGRMPEPAPRGYRFGKKDNLIKYGDYWFDATDWTSSWAGAAGDMYSTLDDLAVFAHAVARGELVGDKGRSALLTWVDAKYQGIEYGFHIFKQNGGIGSLGDMPGFSSFAVYMPEQDVTIVCLANLTATSKKLTAAAELGELTVKLLNGQNGPMAKTPTTAPAAK